MPGHGAEELLSLCERDWLREKIAACLKTESWKDMQRKPADGGGSSNRSPRRFTARANSIPRRDYAEIETARSHVAALRAWSPAIASVTAFWNPPDQPVPLEEFWRIAADAIESAVVPAAGRPCQCRPRDERLRSAPVGCRDLSLSAA